jgi:hypothetical protein
VCPRVCAAGRAAEAACLPVAGWVQIGLPVVSALYCAHPLRFLFFSFLFFLCAPTAEYDDDDSQGDDGEGVEEEEEEEDFSSEEEESDDESDSSMERYRRRGY